VHDLSSHPVERASLVDIDGGGAWTKFCHVTLPMVSPTLFYTLILGIIAADSAALLPRPEVFH
jgi:multiple sugar transport system permease protein